MLKIAICCGEGFASGFLSKYLAEGTVKEHLQDQVEFIFIPFYQLYDRQDEVDIALALPHIEPQIKSDTSKREYRIPIYMTTWPMPKTSWPWQTAKADCSALKANHIQQLFPVSAVTENGLKNRRTNLRERLNCYDLRYR